MVNEPSFLKFKRYKKFFSEDLITNVNGSILLQTADNGNAHYVYSTSNHYPGKYLLNKLLSSKAQGYNSKSFARHRTLITNNLTTSVKDFTRINNDLAYSSCIYSSHDSILNSEPSYNYNVFASQDESSRVTKTQFGKPSPITLVKMPVQYFAEGHTNRLFKLRFADANSTITSRNAIKIPYFVFKQVRYKRRKNDFNTPHSIPDGNGGEKIVKRSFSLNNQYSVENDIANPARHYRMFRKNRVRSETMPIVVAKRLLRVKRTLVVPTHINITAITNSYDVVHSWFIPGLGLKMDCVPGRSTHHTFYVDNAGFYYGQCAEICGRYHHHMPIRVCALPFEHFLIWWNRIALPQLLHPNKKHSMLKAQSFREFV
jgi:heme/copper-type cytochrome/quinol oxidase subunit 2